MKRILVCFLLTLSALFATAQNYAPQLSAISTTAERERHATEGGFSGINMNGDSFQVAGNTKTKYTPWVYIGNKYWTGNFFVGVFSHDGVSVADTDTTARYTLQGVAEFGIMATGGTTAQVWSHVAGNTLFTYTDTLKVAAGSSCTSLAYPVFHIADPTDTLFNTGDKKPFNAARLKLVWPDSTYAAAQGVKGTSAKNVTVDVLFFFADTTR